MTSGNASVALVADICRRMLTSQRCSSALPNNAKFGKALNSTSGFVQSCILCLEEFSGLPANIDTDPSGALVH